MKAKLNTFIDKLETFGSNKVILWGTWALYTMLVIALCFIHEPWGDEHHVWSMVYRLSIPELLSSMRSEGHFCLWHFCVWPWVRILGMDYHAIFVASTILMSLATWLMLFKLDFSFLGKLLIIFSAPFFYQFPVIARCYALIPPILVALAIVYQRKNNPFLYCFLIGLLAHTHAYMEGMVAVLWCLFVYYHVYVPYKNGEKRRSKRNLYASIITIVMVLLAFAQIAGGITDAYNGTSVATKRVNHPIDWLLYVYTNHHIQFSTTLHQIIGFIPKVDLPFTLVCYCVIIIGTYCIIKNSSEKASCAWIVLGTIVWQILFAINIYSMWFQRVFLIYLPILYVIWIANTKANRNIALWILLCFWFLNTSSQYQFIKDIKNEYCFDVSAANELVDMMDSDLPVISHGNETTRLFQRDVVFMDNPSQEQISIRDIEIMSPTLSSFYLVTDSTFVGANNMQWRVDTICSVEEGNHEFTGIGYKKEIHLYRYTKNYE